MAKDPLKQQQQQQQQQPEREREKKKNLCARPEATSQTFYGYNLPISVQTSYTEPEHMGNLLC